MSIVRPVVYFNEYDPYPAKWLVNLFPDATIDARSITDVRASDTNDYLRCHFFAGIGGWELALQLAGWPAAREVWTGSCPCQPFSVAGKRKGKEDERHLWPEFLRLIAERLPATIFGEQVASKDGREWLSGVFTDLEALGYAVAGADLCGASVGAPHIRQRLFWVAHHNNSRLEGRRVLRECPDELPARADCVADGISDSESDRRIERWTEPTRPIREPSPAGGGSDAEGVPDANSARCDPRSGEQRDERRERQRWDQYSPGNQANYLQWGNTAVICADGKARRIEPSILPLANGIPNRVGRIRAYGNAIIPQVAAQFIAAFLDTET